MVLCAGWLEELALPSSGRRNLLGSFFGPTSHEYLNPTHPGLLATLRTNTDVQLPYRLPINEQTCTCETGVCGESANDRDIIVAAQVAQDAQAGYACDYCSKRQPMAFQEVKQCI